MLFTGLAAKIHCQSGFAQSTAGFYPISAETSHSERLPEVTAPCYSQRKPGKAKEMLDKISLQAILVLGSQNTVIGINVMMYNRNLSLLLTARNELRGRTG